MDKSCREGRVVKSPDILGCNGKKMPEDRHETYNIFVDNFSTVLDLDREVRESTCIFWLGGERFLCHDGSFSSKSCLLWHVWPRPSAASQNLTAAAKIRRPANIRVFEIDTTAKTDKNKTNYKWTLSFTGCACFDFLTFRAHLNKKKPFKKPIRSSNLLYARCPLVPRVIISLLSGVL